MADIDYEITRQDSGWIYVIDSRRSPVFATRAEAESAAKSASERREERENQLDEGLEETFPASDPVSVTRTRSR